MEDQKNTNTGNYNTGYRNAGDYNTGNRNTGDWNTGNYNTGYHNTGDWNTGNRNTGYCNTITPEDIIIFNKPAKISDWKKAIKPTWLFFNLTKWIYSCDMTQIEKEQNPSHETAGGYLRKYDYQQAALKSWDETTHEDRMLTYALPNFDAVVAQEIFGIDFDAYLENCSKDVCINEKFVESNEIEIITLNGKRYKLID